MASHPLFPLAATPDVDLEQAGGTNVAVDETLATAERFSSTAHPGRDHVGGRQGSWPI